MTKVRKIKRIIFFINKILSADNRKIQVRIKVRPAKQGGEARDGPLHSKV